ncbi:MAG: hypothetical protein KDK72_02535 [Chlamydiia bacterium]|nr:hypothetical protein [Chlamydiia bacterium]
MNNYDLFVTYNDLIAICRRAKKKIILTIAIGAIIGALFALTRPVNYRVEATFRDKGKKQNNGEAKNPLISLLEGQSGNQSEAKTLFTSERLASDIIKDQGLQAIIRPSNRLKNMLYRIGNNIKAEYAAMTNYAYPLITVTPVPTAQAVEYAFEYPTRLSIHFTSDDNYHIFNTSGREMGEGTLGKPFTTDGYTFTLANTSGHSFRNNSFVITLEPMERAIKDFANRLHVEADKKDQTLVKLTYRDSNRQQAATVLNGLMAMYQRWQEEQHQRIADKQVAYLEQREKEGAEKLEQAMLCYAQSQESDLSQCGFATTEIAMESLNSAQQSYKAQQRALDLESKRLAAFKEGTFAYYDRYNSNGDPTVINELLAQIRRYQKQAEAIEIMLDGTEPTDQFQGMTLEVTHELYLNYSKELEAIEAERIQGRFLIEQLRDPAFELTSLSTVANDQISREIVTRYSELLLAYKDEDNRSSKEQKRLGDELTRQRQFLEMHLTHSQALLKLRENLLKGKIRSLQAYTLTLIKQEIALLNRQLHDYVAARLNNLGHEQATLTAQQHALNAEMTKIPKQWIAEKMVQHKMNLTKEISQELTKLVETKNISNNMEVVQSIPIDHALPPLHPKPPLLILFTIVGAAVGGFISIATILASETATGMRISPEVLKIAKQPYAGSLDEELPTLRRLLATIDDDNKMITLILGNGRDYSTQLAKLLAVRGDTVLIIPITFDSDDDDSGLLSYLEGKQKTPTIYHTKYYDYITAGGSSAYSTELTAGNTFRNLLKQYDYDRILLVSRTKPASAEAKQQIKDYPCLFLTLSDEKVDALLELFAYNEQTNKITFVMESPHAQSGNTSLLSDSNGK